MAEALRAKMDRKSAFLL